MSNYMFAVNYNETANKRPTYVNYHSNRFKNMSCECELICRNCEGYLPLK